MIEFKDNYIYKGLKDIFIRDGKKTLKIFYGGNGDLYFDILGERRQLDSQIYEYIAEFLIKNGNEEWFLFNKLINDIINDQDRNKEKLVQGNIVNWYSDEIYDEKANKLSIERLNEGIKLTFLDNPDDPSFGFGIRICNSGSKYKPFNIHFMKMYNEFQTLSKQKEKTIDIDDEQR